jgi:hypothetical protein
MINVFLNSRGWLPQAPGPKINPMFDILEKYKDSGHFFFTPTGNLNEAHNAPDDKAGICIIYALKNGAIELVFVRSIGEIKKDGQLFIPPGGIRRLFEKNYWLLEMSKKGIEALDIYWYVTHNNEYDDCPKKLEKSLLRKYKNHYGQLPRWNR